ncbi:MAG: hypothetical protein ACLSHO_00620 [Dysosmobacter sp.]
MNLQDDTIQLLVDLVEKEQRRLDQFQPDSQDYARRFHALMDRFADDQPLRKSFWGWRTSTVSSTAATSTSFSGWRPAGSGFGQYRRFAGPVNLEKSVELWYF